MDYHSFLRENILINGSFMHNNPNQPAAMLVLITSLFGASTAIAEKNNTILETNSISGDTISGDFSGEIKYGEIPANTNAITSIAETTPLNNKVEYYRDNSANGLSNDFSSDFSSGIHNDGDTLDTVTVNGVAETKSLEGKDQVYFTDQVTEYKSKEEIDAYRGNSAGDLLSGFSGVYSGDVRNGGAVDPIIRGSSGQGRVPVLVDDTQQAITVWRGFAGVSNRNYLDPFLISSVNVEKGAKLGRDLDSGPDGTVRMTTLEVDDVVKPGEKFGFEIKAETATNSTEKADHPYTFGEDYRYEKDSMDANLGAWSMMFKQSDRRKQQSGNRNKPFDDNAIRIAAAFKEDNIEGLVAYADRKKGNYYAGGNGADKYGENINLAAMFDPYDTSLDDESKGKYADILNSDDAYVPLIGMIFRKKLVVPNTSYKSKSWLGKTKIKFNEETELDIGLRHTELNYGDIMPSRLYSTISQLGTVVQWPEANVKQTAFNTKLTYNPENNPLIDFKVGGFYVNNKSKTNTAGGTPGDILYEDRNYGSYCWTQPDADKLNYCKIMMSDTPVDMHTQEFRAAQKEFMEAYKNNPIKAPNINGVLNTQEAQVQTSQDNHWGVNVSNRFELNSDLSLDVMANYRQETLDSSNVFELWDKNNANDVNAALPGHDNIRRVGFLAVSGKRKGKRKEFNAGFNFTYTPKDWLMLTAGARFTHYKLRDDGLAEKIASGDIINSTRAYDTFNVEKLSNKWESQEIYDKAKAELIYELTGKTFAQFEALTKRKKRKLIRRVMGKELDKLEGTVGYEAKDAIYQCMRHRSTEDCLNSSTSRKQWKPDKDGVYHAENHPLLDGTITKSNETITNLETGEKEKKTTIGYSRGGNQRPFTQEEIAILSAEKSDHAWAPSLSATAFINDDARVYARYNETKRMPSIFEGTTGYSADGIDLDTSLKPEHTKSFELGYVQNLTGVFPDARRADLRVNYFHNTTKNIYDRDGDINHGYVIKQFDKKTREGIELQARYDQGRFFGDISATYSLKNKLCDKAHAIHDTHPKHIYRYLDGTADELKTYPTCVNGGFSSGYLKNTILPKTAIVGNLGFRAFDEKLEVGTRLTYHNSVKDTFAKSIRDAGFETPSVSIVRWQPTILADAYVKYRVSDDFDVSLSGTNLTDRYYLDPYSRSSMPGPGRTLKLELNARF